MINTISQNLVKLLILSLLTLGFISGFANSASAQLAVLAPTIASITFSPTSVASNAKFSASWSGNNGATLYNIRIDASNYNMGTAISWTGTPASLGLAAGTHTISVQACNASGCSPWSTGKTLTVVSSAPTIASITLSSTKAATNAKFSASWSGNNGATLYNVKIDASNYNMGTAKSWTGTPASLGLTAGTHTISVQACNASGCSPWSTEKTLTVTATSVTGPIAPTTGSLNFSPTSVATNANFTASWYANNSPTAYKIKVGTTIYDMGTTTTWTGTPASLGLAAGAHTISGQACNSAGCSAWTVGKTLTVTSASGTGVIAPTPGIEPIASTSGTSPVAPTTGSISFSPTTVATDSNFTAYWYANNNPTAFKIKVDATVYDMGTTGTWTGTPASLGLAAGTHTISGQACNSAGCSAWTTGKTLTVTAASGTGVIAPTTGSITFSPTAVAANSNFTANWYANNSPTSYKIKVDATVYDMGTAITWTGTPASLGLTAGTHTISGQACNSAGCSAWTTGKTLTVTSPTALISVPASSPIVAYSEMSNTSCVDLSQNLSKGVESSSVLSLQNFLINKGLLATQPTAYFGALTSDAVKSYQRSVGLKESGMVYELTRQAIKKETCSI